MLHSFASSFMACVVIVVGVVLDIAGMNGLSANNPLVTEVVSALNVGLEFRTDLSSQFINHFLSLYQSRFTIQPHQNLPLLVEVTQPLLKCAVSYNTLLTQ